MKKKITQLTLVLALSFCCSLPLTSSAQDGSLDLSFGAGGKVVTDFGMCCDRGNSVVIQSNGKIVVAGEDSNVFAVARYNVNGTLDNTFDSDGKVTTIIGGNDGGYSVAIQNDGKIVVAGECQNGSGYDFAVVRYNVDGSLDVSFDSDGKVITDLGSSSDHACSVAIQSDGKIVVAGRSHTGSDYDFAVVRYNTNGTLDNSFDSDGKITTAIGSSHDRGYSVVIQNDGKIVVVGRSENGSNRDFAAVRYNVDGSLDVSFDSDGKVITAIGSSHDGAYSVAIQSDGKIVAAGYSENGSYSEFAVVRYDIDGSLDNSFDVDGKVITTFGSTIGDGGQSVAIQSDGKIVVAGCSLNGSDYDFTVVRYNTNGILDTSFDSDGKVITAFGSFSDDYGQSVAIQSDGKIVVAGGSEKDFAVVRYNSTPVGISELPNPTESLSIYPNPFSSTTTIQNKEDLTNASFTLYNSLGEQVKQLQNINGKKFTFQREDLASGLYFLQLTQENKSAITSKVIIAD